MKDSAAPACGGMPPPEAPLATAGRATRPARLDLKRPEIPEGPVGRPKPDKDQAGPIFAWTGGGEDEVRDTSKPIAYDEKGRPLFAPRGFMLRLPWR